MPTPKIIHQFWEGDRPEEIRQMMLSIRKFNPTSEGWVYRLWHESNISDLGLNCADLKDKCQNWASVSNIVRLHAVHNSGGIWCDSDIIAHKSFDQLLAYEAFTALQDEKRACNAFFGATAGHPWLKWQIARQEMLLDADAAKGVYLMSNAPLSGVDIIPTHWCYPYSYETSENQRHPHRDSICEHKWQGSWTDLKA